jgi:hypothetical protein
MSLLDKINLCIIKQILPCESGGVGRRTGLRIRRGNPWGFESPLSHQYLPDITYSVPRKIRMQSISKLAMRLGVRPAASHFMY